MAVVFPLAHGAGPSIPAKECQSLAQGASADWNLLQFSRCGFSSHDPMHICLSHELPSRFVRFWVLFPENKWDLGTGEDSDDMPRPHPPRSDAEVALLVRKSLRCWYKWLKTMKKEEEGISGRKVFMVSATCPSRSTFWRNSSQASLRPASLSFADCGLPLPALDFCSGSIGSFSKCSLAMLKRMEYLKSPSVNSIVFASQVKKSRPPTLRRKGFSASLMQSGWSTMRVRAKAWSVVSWVGSYRAPILERMRIMSPVKYWYPRGWNMDESSPMSSISSQRMLSRHNIEPFWTNPQIRCISPPEWNEWLYEKTSGLGCSVRVKSIAQVGRFSTPHCSCGLPKCLWNHILLVSAMVIAVAAIDEGATPRDSDSPTKLRSSSMIARAQSTNVVLSSFL